MSKYPVEIIDNTEESFKAFHDRGWGSLDYYITPEQLRLLQEGKAIAIDDGEYTHTIVISENDKP